MATTRSDEESECDGRRIVGEPPGCAADRVPECEGGRHRNVPLDPPDEEVQAVVDQYERVLDARRRDRARNGGSAASQARVDRTRRRSDSVGGVRAKIRDWIAALF